MIGIIPCAGKGSRLGLPFPKELLPDLKSLSYYPILQYTIDGMVRAGIEHLIVTIAPTKYQIMEYLGNGKKWGIPISYVVHPQPVSLPHSLMEARHLLRGEPVMFGHPDTVVRPDDYFVQLRQAFERAEGCKVVLGCFQTSTPERFGMLRFDENHVVTELDEKPKQTDLTWMWGPQIWPTEFVNMLAELVDSGQAPRCGNQELDLTDAMNLWIGRYGHHRLRAFPFPQGSYTDMGVYQDVLQWIRLSDPV